MTSIRFSPNLPPSPYLSLSAAVPGLLVALFDCQSCSRNGAASLSVPDLPQGAHTLQIEAHDETGAALASPLNFYWTVTTP